MKRLGLVSDQQNDNTYDLEAYVKLFDHPLPTPHIAALAALFGWTVPDDGEARAPTLAII